MQMGLGKNFVFAVRATAASDALPPNSCVRPLAERYVIRERSFTVLSTSSTVDVLFITLTVVYYYTRPSIVAWSSSLWPMCFRCPALDL